MEVRRMEPNEIDAVLALREAVFCDEQGVSLDLERDGRDGQAVHIVAVDSGEVVGTCRLLNDGDVWRLGRMAVRRDRRGTGLGAAVLEAAHREVQASGGREVRLAAQVPVREFYTRYGYKERGDIFVEADIEHVWMRKTMEGAAR
jgi:predicted GNAT family N-acyltransferase